MSTFQTSEKTKFSMKILNQIGDHAVFPATEGFLDLPRHFIGCSSKFAVNHVEDDVKSLKLFRYVAAPSVDDSAFKTKKYGTYVTENQLNKDFTLWDLKPAVKPFRIITFDEYKNGTLKIYDDERKGIK